MSHDCWDVCFGGDWEQAAVPRDVGRLIDTATAAVALGITPGAVRQLGVRGRLVRYGTRRRQMWNLWEVRQRALEKKYGNSRVSLDTI